MAFRRATIWAFGIVALGAAAAAHQAPPAPNPPARPYAVNEITAGPLYWVPDGPGNTNTVIVIGAAGVIVIDSKTDMNSGRQVLEIVGRLTTKPVTHVIETHSDSDHMNGIQAFPGDVRVIAHANNRMEQLQMAVWEATARCLPPADRLPMEALLALDVDRFVTGHGPRLFSKADVRSRMAEVRTAVDRIEALAAGGRPVAEIEAAVNTPAATNPSCLGLIQPTATYTTWNEWRQRQQELQ